MLQITDEEFKNLASFIKKNCGINLKKEKKALVIGRLSNLLTEKGMNSFTKYYEQLLKDKDGIELSILIDKITTNHTYFMRESGHFYYFKDIVLPYIKETKKNKDLRVWCAASSSGEEPYTLAMIIDEFCEKDKMHWDKKILATDLSPAILEEAKKGTYSFDKIKPLPKIWVINYFDKYNDAYYCVKQSIKSQVIYRRFNLLEPNFPFKKKFQVIFCRNVMIYFDNETKEELINKLYDNLEYGGYLFIGYSESLNREKTKFKYIQPAIYRKI